MSSREDAFSMNGDEALRTWQSFFRCRRAPPREEDIIAPPPPRYLPYTDEQLARARLVVMAHQWNLIENGSYIQARCVSPYFAPLTYTDLGLNRPPRVTASPDNPIVTGHSPESPAPNVDLSAEDPLATPSRERQREYRVGLELHPLAPPCFADNIHGQGQAEDPLSLVELADIPEEALSAPFYDESEDDEEEEDIEDPQQHHSAPIPTLPETSLHSPQDRLPSPLAQEDSPILYAPGPGAYEGQDAVLPLCWHPANGRFFLAAQMSLLARKCRSPDMFQMDLGEQGLAMPCFAAATVGQQAAALPRFCARPTPPTAGQVVRPRPTRPGASNTNTATTAATATTMQELRQQDESPSPRDVLHVPSMVIQFVPISPGEEATTATTVCCTPTIHGAESPYGGTPS